MFILVLDGIHTSDKRLLCKQSSAPSLHSPVSSTYYHLTLRRREDAADKVTIYSQYQKQVDSQLTTDLNTPRNLTVVFLDGPRWTTINDVQCQLILIANITTRILCLPASPGHS